MNPALLLAAVAASSYTVIAAVIVYQLAAAVLTGRGPSQQRLSGAATTIRELQQRPLAILVVAAMWPVLLAAPVTGGAEQTERSRG